MPKTRSASLVSMRRCNATLRLFHSPILSAFGDERNLPEV